MIKWETVTLIFFFPELVSTQWSIKSGLQAPDDIQEQLQREAIIR